MSVFVGLFWSLFVFDMVGDSNPTGGLIAAVMMIITCPLVFISLQWILSYISTDTDTNSSGNGNDYKHRINDGIEKISQSVHGSIWRCIHSILMMKEIVNTNDNYNDNSNTNSSNNNSSNNSNNNDDNRDTRITETISPLSAVRIQ